MWIRFFCCTAKNILLSAPDSLRWMVFTPVSPLMGKQTYKGFLVRVLPLSYLWIVPNIHFTWLSCPILFNWNLCEFPCLHFFFVVWLVIHHNSVFVFLIWTTLSPYLLVIILDASSALALPVFALFNCPHDIGIWANVTTNWFSLNNWDPI